MIKSFYYENNKSLIFVKKNLTLIKLASILPIIFILASCPNKPDETNPKQKIDQLSSLKIIKPSPALTEKIYQNELFWEVTVDKIGTNKYMVKGKGKNSISSFKYVVEDGHYQIINSFATVDKANPEWGTFKFTFEAKKIDKNTTLILSMYEKNLKENNKNKILNIPLK